MVGYNIYYVPLERDEQTGEEWESEPVFMHLAYGSQKEADIAKMVLETLYGEGRIEVSAHSQYISMVE